MARMRAVMTRFVFAWLLCHAMTLTVTPTVVLLNGVATVECSCAHGDHGFCPMHHKPVPGSELCLMQSADDSRVATFSWLLNAGLVPPRTATVVPERQQVAAPVDCTTASLQPAPPDPPPPRA
jgi:hypothetical protein